MSDRIDRVVVPPPVDLPALISAIARQDRAAFRTLYRQTSPKLLAIILRIVRERAAAEDVLQDVFLRIWQNARGFSPDAARPMSWLIAIARNRSIDLVRQRREVLMPPAQDGTDWYATIAEKRDREGEFADLDRLRVCLDRLEDDHRRCFLQAYYEGLSREELAQRYDRPVNTIKTWLHRAARSLRECLHESEP